MIQNLTRHVTQIEQAFSAGYDPALELANRARPSPTAVGSRTTGQLQADDDENALGADGTLRRADQDMLDRIVHGEESGRYFMLLGPKVRRLPFLHPQSGLDALTRTRRACA